MIQPTIGHVVLFRPTGINGPTWPALIACVHSDRLINIGGFDPNGDHFKRTSVRLVQDDGNDGEAAENAPFAEWMPYQKGQAAKADASQPSDTALLATVNDLNARLDNVDMRVNSLEGRDVTPAKTETPEVAPEAAPVAPEPDATLAVETKVYSDGSSATGVPPLPDLSPEQQDAAAAAAIPETTEPATQPDAA